MKRSALPFVLEVYGLVFFTFTARAAFRQPWD